MDQFVKILNWMERFCYIRPKRGKCILFKCNAVQEIMANYVAWCWHLRMPVKAAIPKFRQGGVSTFWETLEYALCELIPGYKAAIVAHVEGTSGVGGADELFGKIITIKNNLKKSEWKASEHVAEQASFLKWSSESVIAAGTIKTGDALGRGGTLSAVHFSEVANFGDKGTDAWGAIGSLKSSMAENPEQPYLQMEIYESTAKGHDTVFHPICEQARDPASGSDVQLIFLPWFLDPGYRLDWAEYRRIQLARGRTDPGPVFVPSTEEVNLREQLLNASVEPHEVYYRYKHRLTDEQLIWRRWAIVNKCNNELDVWYRHYPSFYEECFTASSTSMFDKDTVAYYRATARPPILVGSIAKGRPPTVFEERHGPLSIWALPVKGAQYAIGADVGGTKPTSDPSCAYVVHKATLEIVACLYGRFESDVYADMLFDLGNFYNTAELAVENNFNPSCANRLHNMGYRNLYYYFVEDKIQATHGKTPGFNTNKKTRPEILSKLRIVTRANDQQKRTAVINDPNWWKEAQTFVWTPKSTAQNPDIEGDYRAQGTNHDDRIMSAAIAYSRVPDDPSEVPDVPPDPIKPTKAYALYQRLMEQRGQATGGTLIL